MTTSPLSDVPNDPDLRARWSRPRRNNGRVLFHVFHDMEAPETATMAEDLGRNWFHTADTKASTHYGVDSDSVVTYVEDELAAYGSHGNDWCLHYEHAGYARQTRAEWLDVYGVAMLDRSARLVAERCHATGTPPVFCDEQRIKQALATGRPSDGGITTHWMMTKALGGGRGHTDPGPFWPQPVYMTRVRRYYNDPAARPILVQGDHAGKPSLGASAGDASDPANLTGAVPDLQRFLKAEGYDLGRFGVNEDGVDGDLGRIGIAAVIRLRSDLNLAPVPIVDDDVWARIDQGTPDDAEPKPEPDPMDSIEESAARHLALIRKLRG